jgi:hypothetical protein
MKVASRRRAALCWPTMGSSARGRAGDRPSCRRHRRPTHGETSTRVPWRWPWARLLQRVFGFAVLVCDCCGGRRRLLGAVTDPHAGAGVMGGGARGPRNVPSDSYVPTSIAQPVPRRLPSPNTSRTCILARCSPASLGVFGAPSTSISRTQESVRVTPLIPGAVRSLVGSLRTVWSSMEWTGHTRAGPGPARSAREDAPQDVTAGAESVARSAAGSPDIRLVPGRSAWRRVQHPAGI